MTRIIQQQQQQPSKSRAKAEQKQEVACKISYIAKGCRVSAHLADVAPAHLKHEATEALVGALQLAEVDEEVAFFVEEAIYLAEDRRDGERRAVA